jgi:hypothetical protein
MTLQRVPLALALAFAIALGGGTLGQAATPKPALLPMLVGSWTLASTGHFNCTKQ